VLARPEGWYRFVGADRGDGRSEWLGPGPCPVASFDHHPFRDLRAVLAARPDALWIGQFSYDLARWVERLPSAAANDRAWPVVELACCPGHAVFDLAAQSWQLRGTWEDDPPELAETVPDAEPMQIAEVRSRVSRNEHLAAVQRAIDYIAAGDIFQVNLAQRFTADATHVSPSAGRRLFADLAAVSPAWYGAYLELPEGRVLASTSPELFLQVGVDGRVVTRPIKGTRPAHIDAAELRDSGKDTAELNMIVDLLRNDLGRVCDYGSIRVSEPRHVESHPTVHHGVAGIEGRLHPSKDVVDLLRAAFPGGSITGAPKVRAMQIIDELEPVRRGPYCGTVGMLTANTAALNIAIRTMLLSPTWRCGPTNPQQPGTRNLKPGAYKLDFSVGGGIVADSDPADEYQETLDKAAAIQQTLRKYQHAPVTT